VFAEVLRRNLPLIQLELSAQQVRLLEQHFNLLNRWNKVLNLTRIQDIEEVVQLHYCESLFLGMHLPAGPLRIVDIGSGAGFPGIPVAILRTDSSVTLVDSNRRKSVFLREGARGLLNVRVLAERADQIRETFDWVMLRAISFSQVDEALGRLAPNLAILGGDKQPEGGFTWNRIKVPFGIGRFLWIHCST
jgi:16S rRNA (guanine527-N7)-methyltransferase